MRSAVAARPQRQRNHLHLWLSARIMEGDECRLHHFISWVAGGRVMRGTSDFTYPNWGSDRAETQRERAWHIETFRLFTPLPLWPLPQSIGASMKPSAKVARIAVERCRLSHTCRGLKPSYSLSFDRSLCFGGVVSSELCVVLHHTAESRSFCQEIVAKFSARCLLWKILVTRKPWGFLYRAVVHGVGVHGGEVADWWWEVGPRWKSRRCGEGFQPDWSFHGFLW